MNSKKSFAEIIEFQATASARLSKQKELKEGNLKLSSCIEEMLGVAEMRLPGNLSSLSEKFIKEQKKLQRKHCSVDKNKNIIVSPTGGYCFTKEAEEALDDDFEKLKQQEVEFEPAYCPENDLPTLSPRERKIYEGFIIEVTNK